MKSPPSPTAARRSRELARADGPSLAIVDWSMPEADGLEVCRAIRSLPDTRYVYAVLLTAHDQDEDVITGFDAGADDYVTKPFNTKELRARVRSGARIVQLQHQLIAARDELHQKAMHDPLTGLLTRGAFFELCDFEFSRAKRSGAPLALFMTDIDHFKSVNDRHGHLGGDEVHARGGPSPPRDLPQGGRRGPLRRRGVRGPGRRLRGVRRRPAGRAVPTGCQRPRIPGRHYDDSDHREHGYRHRERGRRAGDAAQGGGRGALLRQEGRSQPGRPRWGRGLVPSNSGHVG